jgi:hypothetical protein
MRYWTGLCPEEAQKMIKDGVEVMMKTALKLLTKKEVDQPQLALLGVDNEAEDAVHPYHPALPCIHITVRSHY